MIGYGNTFENFTSQCPYCGGEATIPDGIYSATEDTVFALLKGSQSSAQLKALQKVLESAQKRNAPPEEIKEAVKLHAPELAPLIEKAPKSKEAFHTWVRTLGVIIATAILIHDHCGGKATIERVHSMVLAEMPKALQQLQNQPTDSNAPLNRHDRRADEARKRKHPKQKKKRR